jgi:hypothetical protein
MGQRYDVCHSVFHGRKTGIFPLATLVVRCVRTMQGVCFDYPLLAVVVRWSKVSFLHPQPGLVAASVYVHARLR